MSGGIGFTKNMQISYKQNRDLLKHNKMKNVSHSGKKTKLVFKKSNEKSLEELRAKLTQEKTNDKIKIAIVFIIVIAITLFIVL